MAKLDDSIASLEVLTQLGFVATSVKAIIDRPIAVDFWSFEVYAVDSRDLPRSQLLESPPTPTTRLTHNRILGTWTGISSLLSPPVASNMPAHIL